MKLHCRACHGEMIWHGLMGATWYFRCRACGAVESFTDTKLKSRRGSK